MLYMWKGAGSTVVEDLTHSPKIKDSNLTTINRREKLVGKSYTTFGSAVAAQWWYSQLTT
jgi:hypothetical protein